MNIRIGIVVMILTLNLVSGCGNHVWHYVRKGDTLYSVSFRYGQDYKQVAQWNHLGPPYIISPGQRLRVSPPLDSDINTAAVSPTLHSQVSEQGDSDKQGVNQVTLSRSQPRQMEQKQALSATSKSESDPRLQGPFSVGNVDAGQ